MQEFEVYTDRLIEKLDLASKERLRLRQEILCHLHDQFEKHIADKLPEPEAIARSLEEFGQSDSISALYASVFAEHQNQHARRIFRTTPLIMLWLLPASVLVSLGIIGGRLALGFPRMGWAAFLLDSALLLVGRVALAYVASHVFRVKAWSAIGSATLLFCVSRFLVSISLSHLGPTKLWFMCVFFMDFAIVLPVLLIGRVFAKSLPWVLAATCIAAAKFFISQSHEIPYTSDVPEQIAGFFMTHTEFFLLIVPLGWALEQMKLKEKAKPALSALQQV